MSVRRTFFGVTPDGTAVDRLIMSNASGVEVHALTYGGIITRLVVPDRFGTRADLVLGYDSAEPYFHSSLYFGAIIGRYANRIRDGRFMLNGRSHQLATNEGGNHLHGGSCGFDKRLWHARSFTAADRAGIVFSRVSPAGEEGYPGALSLVVTYVLNDRNQLRVSYEATTDAPTIVNLTQHTYFDLSAGTAPDVLDHVLTLPASHYTPVGVDLIPTGEIADVRGTPMDFRTPTAIGARIDHPDQQLARGGGYDHNWVLDHPTGSFGVAARVEDPRSGRTLEVWTSEPGVQFYSGNRLGGTGVGKDGRSIRPRTGFCLETQHFPDSPSHPHFPSTILQPGETFLSHTLWKFGLLCGR